MFCSKCGSSISEGAKFCPQCGEPVKSPGINETQAQADTAQGQNMQKGSAIPSISSLSGNFTGNGSGEPKEKKAENLLQKGITAANKGIGNIAEKGRKSGIKPGMLIAGAAVLLVCIIVAFNGAAMGNFIHRTFSSPEKYYLYLEKKTVKEFGKNFGEIYDTELLDALNVYDKSVEGELEIALGSDGQEFLELLGLTGVDLSWFKGAAVGVDASSKNNMFSVGANLSLNKTKMLSGNLAADMEKGAVYARIPELSKVYLGIEAEELGEYEEIQELQESDRELLKAFPKRGKVEKLINRYALTALKNVNNVSKKKDTLSVEGIKQKCTVLKITFDGDTMHDMAEAVLQEAIEDKELREILINVIRAGSASLEEEIDPDELYEEFQEELEYLLNGLEHDFDGMGDLVMKVYVNGRGEIIGRSIEQSGMKVSSLMPEKGSRFGYELSLARTGGFGISESIKLAGSGKRKGNRISGDFDIKYNNASLINVTAKKLNTEDLKEGRLNGRIEVRPASKLGSVAGYVPGLSIIEDMQLNMDFQSSAKDYRCKAGLVFEGQDIGTVSLSVKTGNGTKASVPDNRNVITVEDEDDFEEWLETVNIDGLISSMKKAGLPSEIIDILEELNDEGMDMDSLPDLMRMLTRSFLTGRRINALWG